jgi:aarF domain-containing kinase
VSRALEVLTALGSFGFTLFLDQRRGEMDRMKRARAIQLRRILTRLGPTFVKIGQGLSTRPDLCPPEYLEELSELQVLIMKIILLVIIFASSQITLCVALI